MFQLRARIPTFLVRSPSRLPASRVSPFSALHRNLSATTSVPPGPFAAEDYLVATCGVPRAQAVKAAKKISHLKSSSKPDAVVAFLSGLGIPHSDIAAIVAVDPCFLCASVERTLAPVVAGLTALGLSRPDIAGLVSLSRERFRRMSIVSKLQYYLRFFGSFGSLLPALRRGLCLLSANLETVVKPNVAFLRECGLVDRDIAKLCVAQPWLLASNTQRVRAVVALAEGIGVPRGCRMFRHALHAVGRLSKEKIAAKVGYLKATFRWSDAEVGVVVSKFPYVLLSSNQMLQSKSEFLIPEVGLEPAYIAHRPALLLYSLEGRMKPRYYVLKFLKENGLLDHDRDYYNAVKLAEKVFVEKFICPHQEAALHLTKDYDAACKGEMPTNFRFT